MVSKQIRIGKAVASALVCLLLCGMVAAEFPGFLSLTDNAANDFTICLSDSRVSTLQPCAGRHARLFDPDSKAAAIDVHFSRLSLIEASLILSDAITSRFILRT